MTTPLDLPTVRQTLTRWEARVPWLYMDNADPPNATVGIGCLIATVEASLSLPWMFRDGNYPGSTPIVAQEDKIRWDWDRVKAIPGGRIASAYRAHTQLVYLDDPSIDNLCNVRIRAAAASLRARYPDWDSLPPDAQLVLIDLEFNLGPGKAAAFVKLRAAVETRDWPGASLQCITVNKDETHDQAAAKPRNAWRVETMAKAGEPDVA